MKPTENRQMRWSWLDGARGASGSLFPVLMQSRFVDYRPHYALANLLLVAHHSMADKAFRNFVAVFPI
jgi:hypothetical protein